MADMEPDKTHMPAVFHLGHTEQVLFTALQISSAGDMVLACLGVFILAIFYEGIKTARKLLFNHRFQKYMLFDKEERSRKGIHRMLNARHFLQSLIHGVQVFIGYCVMLVFMTMNVWLCLAIVLGASVGFFVFGWTPKFTSEENYDPGE